MSLSGEKVSLLYLAKPKFQGQKVGSKLSCALKQHLGFILGTPKNLHKHFLSSTQDEEVAKNKRKQFGDTKHFCPVSYKENYVLWPGNPECAGKYREKVYYFNNADTRDLFLSDPVTYVAKGKSFVVSSAVIAMSSIRTTKQNDD